MWCENERMRESETILKKIYSPNFLFPIYNCERCNGMYYTAINYCPVCGRRIIDIKIINIEDKQINPLGGE